MPKYEVVFTRTITESTTIIGYADDLEQAKDAALELLWSLESADWELDDLSPAGEAYITSVEEVE
jgi:hypothetical protein